MVEDQTKSTVVALAEALSFDRIGFAAAGPCRDTERLDQWITHGFQGEMGWMERNTTRRTDPREILPGARTVISLATFYSSGNRDESPWAGKVSRYARGADYHNVLERRLKKLCRAIGESFPGSKATAGVDHRPILEKEWAERSGIGWIGKHTNVITQDAGSWFFLSEVITDLAIEPQATETPNRCGKCTDCLDACPTGAIVAPYQVDARRCISYLTIELKGVIPRELRPLVGEWIFGCDICQDVCPWNRFAVEVREPRFALDRDRFRGELTDYLQLTKEEFEERFRGSPVRRPGRDGFVRNVCVSLGNRRDSRTLDALANSLRRDTSELVRGHAAWAIGRIGGDAAIRDLRAARGEERSQLVIEEIDLALEMA